MIFIWLLFCFFDLWKIKKITGLEYLRSRYYDTSVGRFNKPDTYLGDITNPQSLNRYAYAENNPVNYVDPSGHVAIYMKNSADRIKKLDMT